MDFTQLCNERYSVRDFSSQRIEEEKIQKIIELTRLSPTARNNQPYEIFIAKTQEALEKVKRGRENLFGAPLVFVVCSDENKNWNHPFNEKNSTLQDIGIVCTTLMYACTEVGLGSLYVCAFNPDELKVALGLSDNLTPETLILVGYPSNDCKPSERHFDRREISQFVHDIK